ncbi:MAG: hypothetical protein WD032_06745 [Nitrospirales bacterium]
MSFGEVFSRDRQVIPRWHTYPVARWLGMTKPLGGPAKQEIQDEDYLKRLWSWKDKGKVAHAADLVGSALVLNKIDDESAIEAAKFISEKRKFITAPLLEIAESFLRLAGNKPFPIPGIILPEETKNFYGAIANLKKRAREYPRNPIMWLDLAFYYSAIGQQDPAEDAAAVALSLNKENRYLLRSGCRFLIHNKSPEKALALLRQSDVGRHDPWLIAAEIALSDILNISSRQIKFAKSMIVSDSISKFHLSELACALGTIEFKNGSRKTGKKMFVFALEDPTENTVAQVSFIKNVYGESINLLNMDRFPHSFEAQTIVKIKKGDLLGALEAAKNWLAYQPFSSRPAVAASYISSVGLGDFEEAKKIAKMGLNATPDEFMLKNNLAFSLASLGEFEEASKVLKTIHDSQLAESDKSVLSATRGVIEFRQGNSSEGRRLYKEAIASFKKQKDMRSEGLAKFFWAREESKINSPDAHRLYEEALVIADKLNLAEILQHFDQNKEK